MLPQGSCAARPLSLGLCLFCFSAGLTIPVNLTMVMTVSEWGFESNQRRVS